MKIYTSYFGKIKQLQENDIVPIAICCYPPKQLSIPNISYVAPTKEILNNYKGNTTLYTEKYTKEILDGFTSKSLDIFLSQLNVYGNGKDVALCCYEKPGDFCHRHLLADYLNRTYNLNIEEFENKLNVDPLF